MKFPYPVPDYTSPTPTISSIELKDTNVTVNGAKFQDTSGSPLTVTLHPVTPSGGAEKKVDKPNVTSPNQIQFDYKPLALATGCWQVKVQVGSAESAASTDKPPKDQFAVPPKIDKATPSGKTLIATGTGLIDLSSCGMPVSFEVVSSATGAKPTPVTPKFLGDGKQATFTLPTAPAGAKWKELHVLLNGNQVSSTNITQ
jgi:hypothetical protein